MLNVSHIIIDEARPTLVFLHDSLGCVKLWRDFPQALGELAHCNVLVYDRQGYGQSPAFAQVERDNFYQEKEADVLEVLLKEHEINRAIAFGHSDGGSIALIHAAKYPARVKAVITEGAHIFVEDITLEGIKQAVHRYQTTDLRQKLQKRHGNKTDALFRAWAQTWLSASFRPWNIEAFLPGIKCPVLVIQGEMDEYGSKKQVDGIVGQVRGEAHRLMIEGAGHTPHKEAREVVLENAARFIRYISPF